MREHSRAGAGTVHHTYARGLRPHKPLAPRGRLRPDRGPRNLPRGSSRNTCHGHPAASRTGSAVLLEWNLHAQGVTTALRPTAHGQTRGIAMVAGAVYDAVNAIDRRHQPYLLDVEPLKIRRWASTDAAIATAAHHVLVALAPDTGGGARHRLLGHPCGHPDGSFAG